MRRDRIFCVRCGKEVDELIDGLCLECYSKKGGFSSIEGRLYLDICSTCGSVRYKGRWLKEDVESAMKRLIIDNISTQGKVSWQKVDVSFKRKGRTLYNALIKLDGRVGDNKVEEELTTEILINKVTCPTCSRKAGRYYEAIIQLRTDGRDFERGELERMEKFIEDRVRSANKEVFVSEKRKVKGGADIYISDKRFAHSLVRDLKEMFGGETKVSPRLFGVKDGVKVYRVTYLLRLPRYRKDDLIIKDGRILQIREIQSSKVRAIDLGNWREHTFRHRELSNCKVLKREDFVRESVVVSRRGRDIQILDPENYLTREVVLPKEIELGEKVKIVKYKDDIFIVPEA